MSVLFPTTLALGITIALVSSCWAGEADSASDKALDLPNDFFPIIPWESLHKMPGWGEPPICAEKALESIAECNFTLSAYASPADLPLIEKLGLKAIMHPPAGDAPWKQKWVGVSDEAVDESVKRWVESCGNSKAIAAYYVTDEPGTPEFRALGAAVAAIKKYAPLKLAYINVYPSYATVGAPDQSQLGAPSYTEYLERFIAEVKPQVLSYDNYMVQYSDDFQSKTQSAIYFKDLLEVRRVALKHGIPWWNTVASCQIMPRFTIPSPASLSVQAYTTLAAGGRGLCWYSYYQHHYGYAPIDRSGNRTDTWHYLRMVNGQVKTLGPIMNRLTSTGVFFSKTWPSDDVPQLPGRIVEGITARSSLQGSDSFQPTMMIGEFTSEDGCDYVMVVNLSLERSANFILKTQKNYSRKEVFSASNGNFSPLDEQNGHWLVPGQGVLIRLYLP